MFRTPCSKRVLPSQQNWAVLQFLVNHGGGFPRVQNNLSKPFCPARSAYRLKPCSHSTPLSFFSLFIPLTSLTFLTLSHAFIPLTHLTLLTSCIKHIQRSRLHTFNVRYETVSFPHERALVYGHSYFLAQVRRFTVVFAVSILFVQWFHWSWYSGGTAIQHLHPERCPLESAAL